MILKYLVNGIVNETDLNNDYVEIFSETQDSREIIKVKALKDINLLEARINKKLNITKDDLIFFNGYQSWTETKENYITEKERDITKAPKGIVNKFGLDRYGDSILYKYHKDNLHGYDVFYIKGKESLFSFNNNYNNAWLIYELNKKTNTLTLISDVNNISLKAGEEFVVYDYYLFNNYDEGLNKFNETFPKKNLNKVFGYTSWYNYYQNINEEIILRDLEGLDSRFNLFQIDDGYETFVGYWLDIDKNKFPNGFEAIVKKIHEKGYKAGIWLAPFVAEEKSKLFREHKELFKRDKKNNLVKAGGNWSGFYLLDMDNKDTLAYIEKCLRYYIDLGFDFFKLDFLYASSIKNRDDLTKAERTKDAYEFLREVLKDKLILGCGSILSSAYGLFDYMRIGPDVSLVFDDVFYMRFMHRERISTKITLRNTIYRSIFDDKLFKNDSDVFLLRDDNIKLTFEQRRALITINALFGSVLMTSDNIAEYDDKKNKLLAFAFDLYNKATNKSYEKKKNKILIKYTLDGKDYKLYYNVKKGILEELK